MCMLISVHGNSSETRQQMLQLFFPELDYCLNFLRVASRQQEIA